MFESVIFDEQDRNKPEPASTLGWHETMEDALNVVLEYISDTAGIYRWEVRTRHGDILKYGPKNPTRK